MVQYKEAQVARALAPTQGSASMETTKDMNSTVTTRDRDEGIVAGFFKPCRTLVKVESEHNSTPLLGDGEAARNSHSALGQTEGIPSDFAVTVNLEA